MLFLAGVIILLPMLVVFALIFNFFLKQTSPAKINFWYLGAVFWTIFWLIFLIYRGLFFPGPVGNIDFYFLTRFLINHPVLYFFFLFLYAESRTVSCVNTPGLPELLLKKDFFNLLNFLKQNPGYKVFLDLNLYSCFLIPSKVVDEILLRHYQPVDFSQDKTMFFLVKK